MAKQFPVSDKGQNAQAHGNRWDKGVSPMPQAESTMHTKKGLDSLSDDEKGTGKKC